ncbi:outer membrane protein [Mesorhizobium koreense]|jgi:outer membrane immunogenic protein|uniref:outer membrane protein n=1 Tax=Mesorhizobium koreense TaxID=3074855 RepID=UPI00287BB982|nr:outer membrane beta-barrel protein [Mesorhizobium sp. WR6]
MKKILYAAVATLALSAGTATAALAADVIAEQPPAPAPVVVPVFSWTGLYLGANLGYGWANAGPDDDNGFVGGGQIGYNYEFDNHLVLGIEGDMDATGWQFDGNDVDYTITGRGRLGYAFDRWMVYGTGGIAYAKAGDLKDTGWVAGAGVEWAATDHIIPGIEYLHYGFRDFDNTGINADADVIRARLSFKF